MKREEAIEVIKKNWPDSSFTMLREALETLIPELKESEDEKIRKWIRKELESKYVVDNIVNNVMADKALAWLGKQGGQKPAGWSDKDERNLTGIQLIIESWDKEHNSPDGIPSLVPEYCRWLESLRPQNWTKEDKERYISCLQRLGTGDPEQPETINSKWFKEHVYPQPAWKPTERQLSALDYHVKATCQTSWQYKETKELLEQLKKL